MLRAGQRVIQRVRLRHDTEMRRSRLKSSRTEWPRTSASPAVGNAARITTFIADVFPAPFAPSSRKISPAPRASIN